MSPIALCLTSRLPDLDHGARRGAVEARGSSLPPAATVGG
jgi:hypothetical protein